MNKKSIFKKWWFWLVATLLIAAIVLAVIEIAKPGTIETATGGASIKSIEDEKLSAENFERLTTQYAENHKDKDETYYLSYAMFNAAFTDGLSQAMDDAFSNKTTDNSIVYKSLFGKTIKELIEDGKRLMKENNVTLEEYKKGLEELNNLGNEE